jgi:DNA modification methylase
MKVAKELHRNSIGYEIDERLVPTIEERLASVPRSEESPSEAGLFRITRRDSRI